MTGSLNGKVAVITGGCSGIGLGTVELFIAEGAKVVCADLQDEKGAMLEARFGDLLRYVHCDVTQEADIAKAINTAAEAFGGLDILFNNAGSGGAPNGVEDMTAEAWDSVQNLLVRSVILGMKHAVPLMRARGGGAIVNTASIAGLQAGWGPLAYSTAKCAVIHLTKCAAAELSPQKIRVNAICPVRGVTGLFEDYMGLPDTPENRAKFMGTIPLGRFAQASDVAAAAVFVASDAAEFFTGVEFPVERGRTI